MPTQVNFLIGDTQGHGLEAGLHMLPIITTFKVVHQDSESTKHTLQRLLPIVREGGHLATALYFVVRPTERGPLLFASSSGHPALMIYRHLSDTVEHLPRDWGNMGAMFGYAADEIQNEPLAEELLLLGDGDVVVAVTDGVLDAGALASNKLRPRGLNAVVFENMSKPAQAIAEAIEEAARRRDNGNFRDDVTIMVLKISHQTEPPVSLA